MKIYLAGPIAGCTDEECKGWRDVVKSRLSDTLDPMRRDYRGREDDCSCEIVEGDKADINQSDALLVNFPHPSTGTCMEIMYAYMNKKIIVTVVPEGSKLSPWLTYHSTKIFISFNEAINYLIDFPHDLIE
jgi:nucleoside 2-deoxyribosyltransferase